MSTRWKQKYHSAGHSKGDVHEAAQKENESVYQDMTTWRKLNLCRRPALGRMTAREGRTRHELEWMSSTKKKNIKPKQGPIAGSKRERSRVTKIDHPSPGCGQGPTVGGLTVKLPPVKVTVEVSLALATRQNHLFSMSYWGEKNNQYLVQYHVPSPAEAVV